MTMYLPNRDVRPTGYEAGEFIEPPVLPMTDPPTVGTTDVEDGDDETGARPS